MARPFAFLRALARGGLFLSLAASAAAADITLEGPQGSVKAGEHCRFTASHPDGSPGAWAWTILEADGGTLQPGEGGRAEYVAPRVTAPKVVHVQVWEDTHPPRVAIRELRVVPEREAAPGKAEWLSPKLEIYAGDPDPAPDARTARFSGIRKIGYLDDPALPGHLNHHWVVADGYGLLLVSQRGEVRPWLGGRERPSQGRELPRALEDPDAFLCTGLATRPPGSSDANPLHLVYSETLRGRNESRVYAVDPAGARRLLGGGAGVGYPEAQGEPSFGPIADLAMDREGNVFVLDRGNAMIRRIGLDGRVTPVAGHRPPEFRDGTGAEAGFLDPSGLALDPATGDLYVSDSNAIRKVTPAGVVTTILGAGTGPGQPGGFALPSEDPLAKVPPRLNCLYHPEGLALQGRNLFIADRFNCALRVLDLDMGTLHTLAGNPVEQHTRRGPLAFYSPGLPPVDCAALASPSCVAFGPDGACLVGTGECIARLDMPPFESPARIARRAEPQERREEVRAPLAPVPSPPAVLAVLTPADPPEPLPVKPVQP